jgi:hypothetical protein
MDILPVFVLSQLYGMTPKGSRAAEKEKTAKHGKIAP